MLVFGAWVSAFGQPASIEKHFQANIKKYSMEHFAEGEDASSGYDYLYYKDRQKIVKISSIWSASHSAEVRVEDFYIDDGSFFFRNSIALKKYLGALRKGKAAALNTINEFYFNGNKLTRWLSKGVEVRPTDSKWNTMEREILERLAAEIENYAWLKSEKQN
jgi:hypothetical protein